jgi:putative hydrolase of the HAD superfamily
MTEHHPDLTHVETWIFDLDNTLYPVECEFMSLIERRMTEFVMRETGLDFDDARVLQKRYLGEHGTTLAGLMANHGVDPHRFLDEVHDVSLDRLSPDPMLHAAMARLPGRRLVFTNGGAKHARRVLHRLQLDEFIDEVFHLEAADFVPKPNPAAYDVLIRQHQVEPAKAAFFEDSERNLKPAAGLGMTTVLVGPKAKDSEAEFVDHRTPALAPFLKSIRVRTPQ